MISRSLACGNGVGRQVAAELGAAYSNHAIGKPDRSDSATIDFELDETATDRHFCGDFGQGENLPSVFINGGFSPVVGFEMICVHCTATLGDPRQSVAVAFLLSRMFFTLRVRKNGEPINLQIFDSNRAAQRETF